MDAGKVSRLLELIDSEYQIVSEFHGNGCKHGFKPAKSCTNKNCDFAEMHRLYDEIKELTGKGE